MPAKQKIPSKQTELDYSLGGFDWVDRDRTLWPMFANLIREIIPDLYRDTLAEQFQTYMELHKAVERLSNKLPNHCSREQLALVHREARKLGLRTTRSRVEAELELFLKIAPRPDYAPLLKASPWPTEFLVQNHIHDQVDALIPVEDYQHAPEQPSDSAYNLRMGNCRMALEAVMSSFYFRPERVQEIPIGEGAPVRVETPERLYMARRYAFDAARNMNKFGRGRRDTGPRRLAKFISAFMGKKHWPRQLAGLPFDPVTHFRDEACRAFVRKYLKLPGDASIDDKQSEAWHFYSVTVAILYDEELQTALLQLAHDADLPERGKHFRNALTELFKRISAAPTTKSQVEDVAFLGADRVRKMKARGLRERDIAQKIAEHLKLSYSSKTVDKGGTFDTYLREAWKKTGLDQPKRRTKARSADARRRSLR